MEKEKGWAQEKADEHCLAAVNQQQQQQQQQFHSPQSSAAHHEKVHTSNPTIPVFPSRSVGLESFAGTQAFLFLRQTRACKTKDAVTDRQTTCKIINLKGCVEAAKMGYRRE